MTRINTNVSALVAQSNLARSNATLQSTLTRLSTGLKINSGADDPAGLIASQSLQSDIIGVQAGIANSQQANQLIGTADSALGQVSSLLDDIRGLVSQAANTGALSDSQIQANQLQVDSSLQAINRIATTTTFQGRRVLDGSLDFVSTAAGTINSAATGTITKAGTGSAAALTLGSGTSAVTFTAKSAGTAANGYAVTFVTGAAAGSETVAIDTTAKTLRFGVHTGGTTGATLANVLSGNSAASAVFGAAGSTGNLVAGTGNTAGGTADSVLTLTAATTGSTYNGVKVTLVTGAATGSETAAYTASTNTLTVHLNDNSTANQISSAINTDGTFTSVVSGNTAGVLGASTFTAVTAGGSTIQKISNLQINQANFGTASSVNVAVNVDTQASQGALTYAAGSLTQDLVLQVGGNKGFNVFNFGNGTTISQIATAINAVSDATGVSAAVASGNLTLSSTDYGSKAFVSAQALSGSFTTTDSGSNTVTRSSGTDISVRINGIKATGDGLRASLNTPTLDLSFSLSNSLSNGSSFNFSITGGGANFQLGPDVVTNQQARLGIQGVSTATLGGVSGTLFELRSGGSKALNTDVKGAGAVVAEVITQLTSLRGRLGAFQRTTLQTNINTLQDTLTNLTSAQSTIKDADFAVESANLTRAQILVQAGTSVLQIANKNPENVLSLLR